MLAVPPIDVSTVQILGALAVVLLAAVAIPVTRVVHRKLRIARGIAAIPGPRGVPLLGMLPALLWHLPRIYHYQEELIKAYGGASRRIKLPVSLFTDGLVIITDPADVQHILSTNFRNYVKSSHFITSSGRTFSKSLFGLNHAHCPDRGAMWALQRKVAGRVFTANNFRRFAEQVFSKHALAIADALAQHPQCDMSVVSGQYTMQAIFDVGCGVPLRDVDASLGFQFTDAMAFVVQDSVDRIMLKPHFHYFAWLMPSEYKRARCERAIDALATKMLTQRLRESDGEIAERSDIMSLFIKRARELEDASDGASVLDLDTLRSIFLTFIIAGWDTTASSITYAFYELARHPEAQQKIVDELQQLRCGAATKDKDTRRVLSYDDVKQLRYLDAVVSESMRMHPTVPANLKLAAVDDHLPDGTFIPAGTEVLYHSFFIGRNSAVWGEDQLVFRPERWLDMKTRPSAYEFPVFQAGPRICPGMNMALLETKLFLAVLLERFHVKLQAGAQVNDRAYVFSATMVMKDGLPLQLTPRTASAY